MRRLRRLHRPLPGRSPAPQSLRLLRPQEPMQRLRRLPPGLPIGGHLDVEAGRPSSTRASAPAAAAACLPVPAGRSKSRSPSWTPRSVHPAASARPPAATTPSRAGRPPASTRPPAPPAATAGRSARPAPSLGTSTSPPSTTAAAGSARPACRAARTTPSGWWDNERPPLRRRAHPRPRPGGCARPRGQRLPLPTHPGAQRPGKRRAYPGTSSSGGSTTAWTERPTPSPVSADGSVRAFGAMELRPRSRCSRQSLSRLREGRR